MPGLMYDLADRVGAIFSEQFRRAGYDSKAAPIYAHALVGMVAFVGQWWTESRKHRRRRPSRATSPPWPGWASGTCRVGPPCSPRHDGPHAAAHRPPPARSRSPPTQSAPRSRGGCSTDRLSSSGSATALHSLAEGQQPEICLYRAARAATAPHVDLTLERCRAAAERRVAHRRRRAAPGRTSHSRRPSTAASAALLHAARPHRPCHGRRLPARAPRRLGAAGPAQPAPRLAFVHGSDLEGSFAGAGAFAWLSNGDGTFTSCRIGTDGFDRNNVGTEVFGADGLQQTFYVDVNGDGLADIVHVTEDNSRSIRTYLAQSGGPSQRRRSRPRTSTTPESGPRSSRATPPASEATCST